MKSFITYTTPQFERSRNIPPPKAPPKTREEWEALSTLSRDALGKMGCRGWDEGLMLFPAEWYGSIPEGMVLEDINGDSAPFEPGKTSDDRRFGLLAYGVRVIEKEQP